MISYAQNFEDIMLWRALRGVDRGLYIDVGANDPRIDSVSLSFYERGWRGVHVEPLPDHARRLIDARIGDVVHQAAIGIHPGEMTFFAINHSGVSTGLREQAEVYNNGINVIETIRVPVVTLAQVFESAPPGDIHWLKIDVEGMETEVLRSWEGSQRRPWIVVVESVWPKSAESTHRQWESILIEKNYRCAYFDGLNRFYTLIGSPIAADAFASPPCVFDDWSLGGGGTSPFVRHLENAATEAKRQFDVINSVLQTTKKRLVSTEGQLRELEICLHQTAESLRSETEMRLQTVASLDQAHALLEEQAASSNKRHKEFDHEILALKNEGHLLLQQIERYRNFFKQRSPLHHIKCLVRPSHGIPPELQSAQARRQIYKNLRKPWHTHLYRALVCLFYSSDKPWHTHIFRAFRSIQGDPKYIPAKPVLVATYPNHEEHRLRAMILHAIQQGKKR